MGDKRVLLVEWKGQPSEDADESAAEVIVDADYWKIITASVSQPRWETPGRSPAM